MRGSMLLGNKSFNRINSRTNHVLHFDCTNHVKISYPLEGLYPQNWALIGTINLILAPITFAVNLLTLVALCKSKDKTFITKAIFTSLCLTDMLTGILAQTFYGVLYITVFNAEKYCFLLLATIGCSYFFVATSFFALLAIHVERFLGVFHPFYHKRIKTDASLIKIIALTTWILTAVSVAVSFFTPHLIMYTILAAIFTPIVFVWSCYVQVKIVGKVHRVMSRRRKVVPQTDLRTERKCHFNRKDSRANKTAGLILVAYIVCYTPSLIINILRFYDEKSNPLLAVRVWAETCVFLNSIFNPLLFCLQGREIREIIRSLLFALLPCSAATYGSEQDITVCMVSDIKNGFMLSVIKTGYLKQQERLEVMSLNRIEI